MPKYILEPTAPVSEVRKATQRLRVGGADAAKRDYNGQEVSFAPPSPGTDGYEFCDPPAAHWRDALQPDRGSPRHRPDLAEMEARVAARLERGAATEVRTVSLVEGVLYVDLAPTKKNAVQDILRAGLDDDSR